MRFFLPLHLCLLVLLQADIVINEISATRSDRLLRWDSNNQPFSGAAPAWWSSSFNDSQWEEGIMPLGYGATVTTDLGPLINNNSPSFYVRKSFIASSPDASSSSALNLKIEYNDGFIAWINGIEVARENMGAAKAHIYHDQLSYRSSTQTTATKTINLGSAASLLTEGRNVIAIQVNNFTLSENMRLDMALEVSGSTNFFAMGSSVDYLPGLREPNSDLSDPADPEHNPADWIELHNNGISAVDLTGWSLTDDPLSPSKWIFPTNTTIAAGGYLIVLANNPDSPIAEPSYLHTNFKLSSDGDFIGLFDPSGAAAYAHSPQYPKQFPNFSYGLNAAQEDVYFAIPSPGFKNSDQEFMGKVDAPDFDHKGGFYDNRISVTLTSTTPEATIRFTIDGTEPTLTNGINYNTPLSLARISGTKGHVIRSRAFRQNFIPSNVKTHTYLIGQDDRLRTAPTLIYAGDEERALYHPFGALAIGGGTYSSNKWQPTTVSDFNNTLNRGRSYERPIHAEFYFPDGSVGFRTNVGLRVSASSWSRPRLILNNTDTSPWTSSSTQKPSFNLYFRDDYGNPKVNIPLNGIAHTVDDYSQFRIRAGKNDISNPFIVDEFVRRLSREMGHGASNGVINSLYVNGELKGYYNMVERLRAPFLSELYNTPDGIGWDILAFESGTDNVADGDKVAWDNMISRLNAPITEANWQSALEIADVTNMADYYLLNIYMATWDWPHNNWIAAKERSDRGRYRLYVWDAEGAMNNAGNRTISTEMINQFIASGSGELRDLWRGLNRWEEFRIIFADRIHKHMFNGGILDDRDQEGSTMKLEFNQLVTDFEALLEVVRNQNSVSTSKFDSWVQESTGRRRYLLGPSRESFRNQNLWPTSPAPDFDKLGGSLVFGETLSITSPEGDIYFTTNGSDPRGFGGTTHPNAISQPGSFTDLTLIPIESNWLYNEVDGDLGITWRAPSYDDSKWSTGQGPIGYGNISDSGTVIAIATTIYSSTPRQPTTYFRRNFEISDTSSVHELKLLLRADAGVVAYLNGMEILHESNLLGTVTYDTIPTSDTSDGNEGDLTPYLIDPELLVNGTNVIAVELHNSPFSSDLIFDLQLDAQMTQDDHFPVAINGPTTVKARTLVDGVWSPLTEASFTLETVPADSTNMAVVEMLYNPAGANINEMNAGFDDGDDFEFLRLQNTSSDSIDLSDVRFVDGVEFDFANVALSVLAPNGVALIVKDQDAFRERYGAIYDHLIAGEYSGKLSNEGENIRIIGSADTIIHEFEYTTTAPWPDLSALDGHSIQIIDAKGHHQSPTNWTSSTLLGGTPDGRLTYDRWKTLTFSEVDLNNTQISGANADPDRDNWNNLFEFALGSSPQDSGSTPTPITTSIAQIENDRYLTLSVTRNNIGTEIEFSADMSADLSSWSEGGIRLTPDIFNANGTITTRFRYPSPITPENHQHFLRLRLSIPN